jgi:hypothetical protein
MMQKKNFETLNAKGSGLNVGGSFGGASASIGLDLEK